MAYFVFDKTAHNVWLSDEMLTKGIKNYKGVN